MLKKRTESNSPTVASLNGDWMTIADVVALSLGKKSFEITNDPKILGRIESSAASIASAVANGSSIYGVTTGFGGMAGEAVQADLACHSQQNLLSFLATGAGSEIAPRHTRAAMLLRANVLTRGCSGVRLELIERLLSFLAHDAIPRVRELGSIGASGDLVPLAVIARAITGSAGKVAINLEGRVVDSATALREMGLQPTELLPKEGLALVNGTSFSSAIAAGAIHESTQLMGLAIGAQSLMLRAQLANESPFHKFVHQCKPHPGQVWSAEVIQRLLSEGRSESEPRSKSTQPGQVQDRYSIRCLPQYLGSIVEGMSRVYRTVEIEMNSVSDNPLIDPESGAIHQSGNFLGQYIGIAMDDLRRFNGLLAKHLDVQIASLVAPEFSGGLPASLRGNEERSYNMGLKGLQITGNSIMPMLTYLGNPIVEHFPTHAEQFNQNINGLSWGAANLAWKSVEQFQQYIAVALIFSVQALDLRAKSVFGHYDGRRLLGDLAEQIYSAICETLDCDPSEARPFLFNDSDRWLEQDLEILVGDIVEHGSLVNSVKPILESFQSSFLGCDDTKVSP